MGVFAVEIPSGGFNLFLIPYLWYYNALYGRSTREVFTSHLYLQMKAHLFKYRFGFEPFKSEWQLYRMLL